jgi:hypothetical protein
LEITPTLYRPALWQSILQLYHQAKEQSLRCLPFSLRHEDDGPSRMILTILCHKAHPDASGAKDGGESANEDTLPLPAECSLLHVAQPEVLIAHTSEAPDVEAAAIALQQAGATVRTMRLGNHPDCATALADAIHAARLVLFTGEAPVLDRLLAHRRVQYALTQLVERDGLCLAEGACLLALCHTELFDELLGQLPACEPIDAFEGAFPFAVAYVRDLKNGEDTTRLCALPDKLLRLRDDIPVGDPMVELFRNPESAQRNILSITQTEDGTPAAVRLVAAGGHLIAFADGFTPAQLREAVAYFQ